MPAAPETIALYIADLGGVAKPATITRRLAAIAKAHQAAGHESPCAMRHAPVKEVLSGIKRTHGIAQAGKAALLTDHLRLLLGVIPDSLLGKRDTAMLLLGFAGAFRRSELVSLTVQDIEFCDDGLKVTLRRSKTDQEGLGRSVGVPYGSNPQLCPVRSLHRWLDGWMNANSMTPCQDQARPGQEDGNDGNKTIFLSPTSICQQVRSIYHRGS